MLPWGRLGPVPISRILRHRAGFFVPQLCPRVEDDSVAGSPVAHGKVKVLGIDEETFLKSPQFLQQIRPNQEAAPCRKSGLRDGVELTAVYLAVSNVAESARPQIYRASRIPDDV